MGNIPKKFIKNRKLIFELRFFPRPKIVDNLGAAVELFRALDIIDNPQWRKTDLGFILQDDPNERNVVNKILLDTGKLAYVSAEAKENEVFTGQTNLIWDCFTGLVSEVECLRIGCRVMSTFSCKSGRFHAIRNNFLQSFNDRLVPSNIELKDLRFHIVYNTGMYQIGPINEGDGFVIAEFPERVRQNHIGFAIDTDNYSIFEREQIQSFEVISEVIQRTSEMEYQLYDTLKEF